MNAVTVRDVSKRYRRAHGGGPRRLADLRHWAVRRERWALRDVSFDVARGETLGIVGANGSGKSTMLRLLAGLTRPTGGSITVSGRLSGLLSLGDGVHPLLSGEENAVTLGILSGLTRREAVRRLPDIAAFSELESYMDQPLRMYSSGMRLRLAFATAVNVDPEILLVDEILSVGDLRFQEKCLAELERLQSGGVTILMISHYLSEVQRLCDRAVWIADGRVRAVGPVDEVAERYERAMTEDSPTVVAPDGSVRSGAREIEITDVRVLDGEGRRTTRLVSGRPLTVEVDVTAHEAIREAIVAISAHRERSEETCFDLNSQADGSALGPLKGPHTLRLHLDRLDLAGGRYRLAAGVYEADWDRPYDYLSHALALEVSATGTAGLLLPPHRWESS